ncbi:MAG: hypothetical protein WC761_00415 [Candidatus Paceibacterota bacterium]|jgi:septation ring formation regulator EzrA
MSDYKKPPFPPIGKSAIAPPRALETGKLQSLEEMVRAMNDKIQRAEVLNGGFSEMKAQVTDIRYAQIKMEAEVKSIRAGEASVKESIEEINDAIYDPDNGIYRRINESITYDKVRDEKLDKAVMKLAKVEEILAPIEKTEEDLKKIAGEDLKELQSIVKTRQIIDRMFWIMLTGLVGGGAKILWDLIAAVNN